MPKGEKAELLESVREKNEENGPITSFGMLKSFVLSLLVFVPLFFGILLDYYLRKQNNLVMEGILALLVALVFVLTWRILFLSVYYNLNGMNVPETIYGSRRSFKIYLVINVVAGILMVGWIGTVALLDWRNGSQRFMYFHSLMLILLVLLSALMMCITKGPNLTKVLPQTEVDGL